MLEQEAIRAKAKHWPDQLCTFQAKRDNLLSCQPAGQAEATVFLCVCMGVVVHV